MSKSWVNCHQHTVFSMLDGYAKLKPLAQRAKELKMPAIAQTDHGNIHGWLDFYDACKEEDIKPILGLEAYQARKSRFDRDEEERAGPATYEWEQRGPYHLSILAKNAEGYKNIIKLSSKSYLEGYYVKPRIDLELLSEHSNGLIVLSGCLNGAVQQALLRDDFDAAVEAAATMQDIVGKENYFIELQNHGIAEQNYVIANTIRVAEMIGAPIVPTGDTHYVHKSDAELHDAMLCISTGATLSQEGRFKFSGPEFYLKSRQEMEQLFDGAWLDNTLRIAEMVDLNLEFGEFHFPSFPDVPPEQTAADFLTNLTWEGIKRRYSDITDEIRDRVNHELGVIIRMGFPEYFLIVQDLVNWAKDNGIKVGPGRGSAAGSIVSYALNITNIDPIRFELLFERFLVEGRKQMPDIDLDFDSRYRDKVIEYARSRYGEDRVAHICTFSSLGARSAIRDAARVLDYEYSVGDKLSKLMPPSVQGVSKTIEEALQTDEFAAAYKESDVNRHVIDTAQGLEGIYRQSGVHAAGVIISRGPITDYVPVMRTPVKGKPGELGPVTTQWDMQKVEQNGLLKIDFLGLRNLDIIDICEKNIKETHGIDLNVDDIDFDDEKTYDLLRQGMTVGTFQIESPGMREMTMAVRPSRFEDIMAIVSLYRPGPMGSGMDKMYVNRKHGRERITYPHPNLEKPLKTSLGIMLYQEDVLNVTRVLGGWDAGSADDLRKAIGKKLKDKIGLYKEKFIKTTSEVSGLTEQQASKIYGDIEYFAGYGFGKAHAAGYAAIAYQTAYLKTHYPTEYMAALLSTVTDDPDSLSLYLNECRLMGLKVLPPSIARSRDSFSIPAENEILFGLLAVKGLGASTVDALRKSINNTKEYKNIYDFFRKADHKFLNKTALGHFISSGMLDELVLDTQGIELSKSTKLHLLDEEKKELGAYVTDHPLLGFWDYISSSVSHTIADLDSLPSGTTVQLGGIISAVKKIVTKQGKNMYRLSFDDLTGSVEVVVFPQYAHKLPEDFLSEGSIGILEARVAKEGDEDQFIRLFYSNLEKISQDLLFQSKPIHLESSGPLSDKAISSLYAIIDRVNGDSPVFIKYREGNHDITMRFKKTTSVNVEENLRNIVASDIRKSLIYD